MGLIAKNDNGSWKLKGVGWSQIKPGAVIKRGVITTTKMLEYSNVLIGMERMNYVIEYIVNHRNDDTTQNE